jgi:1-phosphatidylinositol phosphodiesterase
MKLRDVALLALLLSPLTTRAAQPYDTWDWMANISNNRYISQITIPGTHDSGALWAESECRPFADYTVAQNEDMHIDEQLRAGVRYLDIRIGNPGWHNAVRNYIFDNPDRLQIYHGKCAQHYVINANPNEDEANAGWAELMSELASFLRANQTETVILSIKNEDGDHLNEFGTMLFNAIHLLKTYGVDTWEKDWIPKLGQVRGKVVVIKRFRHGSNQRKVGGLETTDEPRHPYISIPAHWEDNMESHFRNFGVHDIYKGLYLNPGQKASKVIKWLINVHKRTDRRFYLTFGNGNGLQTPSYVNNNCLRPRCPVNEFDIGDYAGVVNPAIRKYLAPRRGFFGVVAMDRLDQSLIKTVLDTNFK